MKDRPTNEEIRQHSMAQMRAVVAKSCGCIRCLMPKRYEEFHPPCPRGMS